MPTVLITGAVVSNGGDRAIAEAELRELEEAFPSGTRFTVSDNHPETARRVLDSRYSIIPWPLTSVAKPMIGRRFANFERRYAIRRVVLAARLRRAHPRVSRLMTTRAEAEMLTVLSGFDVMIHTGGTSLVENYPMTPKVFDFDVAEALGVPLVLMTQSLGPFTNPENVRNMRRVCEYAKLVLLRDTESQAHLSGIGASTDRVIVRPDVVFSLTTERSGAGLAHRRLPSGNLNIGISVRELTNFGDQMSSDNFKHAIGEFVTELVKAGHRVTFISTCQGIPEYWTDDSRTATEIVAGLPAEVSESVRVDREFHTTAGLIDCFGEFDLVIGTRLHACILSLVAGTLVLPVAYEFKTHTVFTGLGAPELVLDADGLRSADLTARLTDLIDREKAIRHVLAAGVARSASAASVGEIVATALDLRHTGREVALPAFG